MVIVAECIGCKLVCSMSIGKISINIAHSFNNTTRFKELSLIGNLTKNSDFGSTKKYVEWPTKLSMYPRELCLQYKRKRQFLCICDWGNTRHTYNTMPLFLYLTSFTDSFALFSARLLLTPLVYPQQVRNVFIFLLANLDKQGMTEL